MPTTYQEADRSVREMLGRVLDKWHRPLVDAEVSFTIQMARNNAGPALKHGGWPADAMVKVTPLKDRVAGIGDVRLFIDETAWEEMDEPQRLALLDHEAQHVELKTYADDEGCEQICSDDIGRPCIKLRKHDWQFGGFDIVAERHKEASHEAGHMKSMVKKWKQLDLPFEGKGRLSAV
jgi:hypothetical protein